MNMAMNIQEFEVCYPETIATRRLSTLRPVASPPMAMPPCKHFASSSDHNKLCGLGAVDQKQRFSNKTQSKNNAWAASATASQALPVQQKSTIR